MKWYQSLKVYLATVLVFQVLIVCLMAGFSLYELELRKHDYAILNLSGQLRVISQAIISQSENYKAVAPRDYDSYNRDLKLYHEDLKNHIDSYDEIIKSFETRNLSAELIGRDEAITCNWDSQSINQLNISAASWYKFKKGLIDVLGRNNQQPRLEAAAEFIVENGELVQQSSTELSKAFQRMMEEKLSGVKNMNKLTIFVFIILNVFILIGFIYKVFKPLDFTRRSFARVANGDLSLQIDVNSKNEIGSLTESFNSLTQRLANLFRLTDRVHQATNLDESLQYFYEECQHLLDVDWAGLVHYRPGTEGFTLDRLYTDFQCELYENEQFTAGEMILKEAMNNQQPVNLSQLSSRGRTGLIKILSECGMQSVLAIPLECVSKDVVILLLAARQENAYDQKHLELLENISAQLSHSLDKTIGMEGLVISTIEGLAKLAESRDPETGDHLTRMSLYSAIIAEQMSKESIYSEQINAAYIRDVFRFSPMHDIGKVGIEDNILLKPGKLTVEEREEMQKHPKIGADVLKRCEKQMNDLGHRVFTIGIEIAESHHEKYDGSGYPNKLKGESIPLSARIVAAADVFDALTSKRPYKDAWPIEKALTVMYEDAGKHFDPEVIKALEAAMPKIMRIYEEHKHV